MFRSSLARVMVACAAVGLGVSAHADSLSIGFEDYSLGTLTGANAGYAGADGRLPGQADGPRRWYSPGNAATYGEVATRAARTGANGLVLIRNAPLGPLDGVINGVQTPRLLQAAGETSAPVNAPNSRFRFSYWFRTGPTTPLPNYRFGAESWSTDRTTWHRFLADSSGVLRFVSVGTINDASLDYFPNDDTLIATNLTWGAWYRVEVTVSFVNGGDDNDVVVTRLYNSSNTLIGTGVDTTWESGQRYAGFNGGLPVAPDSFAFQARAAGEPFTSYAGDVAYVDDITVESLPPVDTKLNIVDACDNDNTIEVTIDLTSSNQPVAGGQFFLAYDTSKLQYIGGTPSATFPSEIIDISGPGTIDYATGISFGAAPVNAPATFATLTFNKLANVCASDALTLVNFRPRPAPQPPTRLTDQFGGPIPTTTTDLAPFTMDGTAPTISCPGNITINSNAGGCSGTLNFTDGFSTSPTLGNIPAPGVWYTDRYAPAGFASGPVPAGVGLVQNISSADSLANRPLAFQSNFYNTQGRKLDVDLPVGSTLGIDLFVPGSWATNHRRADIWGTAFDSQNAISGFPIIGFMSMDNNDDPNNPTLPTVPRYRVWDPNNNVWVDLATPVVYNAYHRLEIQLTATDWVYKIDGTTVATFPNGGSLRIGNTILQAYNFGSSYSVYWDNLTYGPPGPVVTDNCQASTSYVRSDNPLLTLADPFPAGTTTVTWTATDCSGNSSTCSYDVIVNPTSNFNATVQLAGVTSGSFSRCISFDFYGASCPAPSASVDAVVNFVNGVGTASLSVPCGSYSCVTARDKRHTLRQTASLSILSGSYTASFTGSDALRGGNLNDDIYVDILDFGGFVGQFGVNYGSANTSCSTPYPHADISGNGLVGIEDFTFIQSNFLAFNEPNCCGNFVMGQPNQPGGPVTDISVAELVRFGQWDTARADVNHDGRLNVGDVAKVMESGLPFCAADFNADLSVSVQDIFDFLSAWFADHPAADVTRDQNVSVQDIFAFLQTWFGGC